MLLELHRVAGRATGLFYSEPSAYLWEDDAVLTEKRGEQGDSLMPLLFSVEQGSMHLWSDIHLASKPQRVGDVVPSGVVGSRQDPSAWWQNPHLEQGRHETPCV